ncbi:hypothetical protein C0J52_08658 [Blattella germanica]|nr:hypothetical protein C0J52_08658 [Blattella germanica]
MDTSGFIELLNGFIAPVSSSIPGKLCQNHSISYINAFRSGAEWATKMWDAKARIQTGILLGNLNSIGDFDECINVHEQGNSSGSFSGEYCLATFSPSNGNSTTLANALGNIVSQGLRWGFCIPSTCTSEDLSAGLTEILEDTNLEVHINRADCVSNEPIPFTAADWIAITFLFILFCTVILSTGYEFIREYLKYGRCAKTPSDFTSQASGPMDDSKTTYTLLTSSPVGCNDAQIPLARSRASPIVDVPCELTKAERPKTLPLFNINAPESHSRTPTPSSGMVHDINCSRVSTTSSNLPHMEIPLRVLPEEECEILTCFSLLSNGKKLFNLMDTKVLLRSVDGIKVLSLCWVIIAQACFITEGLPAIHYLSIRKNIGEWQTMVVLNSQLAANTFLVCTGALISYNFLRDMRKRGIFRRHSDALSRTGMSKKLTPALAVLILLQVGLLNHIASGPFWGSAFQHLANSCKDNWWGNLLYIQNIFCGLKIMVDMQLYLLSPIILLEFLCWTQRRNLITVGSFILLGIVYTFVQNYLLDLPAGFLHQPKKWIQKVEFDYAETQIRIAPWLIGMVLGYLLYLHRRQEILKPSLPKWLLYTGWVLSPLAMIYALFGLLAFENQEGINHIWSAMYNGGSHSIWAMGIAWIIFACETNHGVTVRFSPARPSKKLLAHYAPLIAELQRSYASTEKNGGNVNKAQTLSGAFVSGSFTYLNQVKSNSPPPGSKKERKISPQIEASTSAKSIALQDDKQNNK